MAVEELKRLTELGALIEIKKVPVRRSLPQNKYLHLLLGAFASHFGMSREAAKAIYKEVNRDIYFIDEEVMGELYRITKSSAKISKDEMTKSIERFRAYSELHGYPLPQATDMAWLGEIENTIERVEQYL